MGSIFPTTCWMQRRRPVCPGRIHGSLRCLRRSMGFRRRMLKVWGLESITVAEIPCLVITLGHGAILSRCNTGLILTVMCLPQALPVLVNRIIIARPIPVTTVEFVKLMERGMSAPALRGLRGDIVRLSPRGGPRWVLPSAGPLLFPRKPSPARTRRRWPQSSGRVGFVLCSMPAP